MKAVLVGVVVAVVAVTAGRGDGCGCWGENKVYVQKEVPITGWYHRSSTNPYVYKRSFYFIRDSKRVDVIFLLRYNLNGYWVLSDNTYKSVKIISSNRRRLQLNVQCPGRCACRRVHVSTNQPNECWAIQGYYTRKDEEALPPITRTPYQNTTTPTPPPTTTSTPHQNNTTPTLPPTTRIPHQNTTPTPLLTTTSTPHQNNTTPTPLLTTTSTPHQNNNTPTPPLTTTSTLHQNNTPTPPPTTTSTPHQSNNTPTLPPTTSTPHQNNFTPEPPQASNTSEAMMHNTRPPMSTLERSNCLLNSLTQCLKREVNGETWEKEEVQNRCHEYTSVLYPSSEPPTTKYVMNGTGKKTYTLTLRENGDFWWIVWEKAVYAVSSEGGPCPDQLPQGTKWQLASSKHRIERLTGKQCTIDGDPITVTCSEIDALTEG